MKRWEVIKGMHEGLFKIGQKFEIWYPEEVKPYYAIIDKNGCLCWLHDPNEDVRGEFNFVHIALYSKDVWKVYNE